MPHMVDDDPPIKTGAASTAYRDNWERIFGEEETPDVTVKSITVASYSAHWSEGDQEFVGRCADYPSLSWLAPTALEAYDGIVKLVAEVEADLKHDL